MKDLRAVVACAAIFAFNCDYPRFQRFLSKASARDDVRLLATSLMPDHFHLILRCAGGGLEH